ncbi:hypothetical protein BHM03_00001812 [Ensete ventricosum]|uniref:POX domain-containing protein n=1 Tax=Ensete ventricosum TaxID=4639 RepID=A0A445M9C2_ENSVE|nr:hypothetical protein BHM03_00001812 [Ensete ventricosum]
MSTFYSMSNDHSGSTPNLGLRDPGHAPYSESPGPGNMMYLSFLNSGPYTDAVAGVTKTQQNHIELPGATSDISPGLTVGNSDMVTSHLGSHGYNAWKDGRNEMLFMQTVDGTMNGADDLLHTDDPQTSMRTQLGIMNGRNLSLQQSNVPIMQNQGLSLSLSTRMPVPSFQYQPTSSGISLMGCHQSTSGNIGLLREEHFQNRSFPGNVSPYGQSHIPNSKYLRIAQELLDEVVNVGSALTQRADKSQSHPSADGALTCKDGSGESKSEGMASNPQEATVNSSNELSPSERQDLQNKVSKLLGMLDEVSNWFINARVRLWKPMIEDMYKEEFGDTEIDSNSSSENPPRLKEDIQSSEDHDDMQNPATGRCQTSQISNSSRPNVVPAMNVVESVAAFENEETTQDSYMNLKISDQRPVGVDSSFLQDALAHQDGSGRFLAYQMAELGRYGNSGVSLTLGLQQCDVGRPASDDQQRFIAARANDVYGTAAPVGPDTADYDYANMGDRQHRLGSTHLLHDFVA